MDWANCVVGDIPTIACAGPLVVRIIDVLLMFSGAVALGFLIYGSIRYLISSGEPKALLSAKNTLTYAIIGLIIVLSSFALVKFTENFLGLPAGTFLNFSLSSGEFVRTTPSSSSSPTGSTQTPQTSQPATQYTDALLQKYPQLGSVLQQSGTDPIKLEQFIKNNQDLQSLTPQDLNNPVKLLELLNRARAAGVIK